MKMIRNRAEEFQITIEYLEVGKIRSLRLAAKHFLANPDDETLRQNVLNEINHFIEVSEQNRRHHF